MSKHLTCDGRGVRDDNVTAAQAKLDAYDETLAVLRPYMEGTERSVSEAMTLMQQEVAA